MKERLAVIGGSGAYHLLIQNRLGEETECQTLDTPFGPMPLFLKKVDSRFRVSSMMS